MSNGVTCARDKRGHDLSVLSQRLARLDAEWQAKVDGALLEGSERIEGARSVPLDPQRARAIPIIGPMAGGGAIPGTLPHRQRQLDRWSGR